MKTEVDLERELSRIDGRGYKAYRTIEGRYRLGFFELSIDHVQGDPFASPSRLSARIAHAESGLPPWYRETAARRVAVADFLTRAFDQAIESCASGSRGSGKSGLIAIEAPGQEVLERTSVVLDDAFLEARFVVGLPAQGRSVLARDAKALLLRDVVAIVETALVFRRLDETALQKHVMTIEDQRALRAQLAPRGLVAFVGDGALLPRRSGVDARPLAEGVVPFASPSSVRVELSTPHSGNVTGMGIPEGVTLIVGGGYHGKSTLLAALELGVYDHIPGDGRERVVCRRDAVKIRAEDGRRVERVDIQPFIRSLPEGRSTTSFCSEDSSGSTSQAANIAEALEAGSRLLCIDEDTSATNFMIRDRRMQALVDRDREPIVPFIDNVRTLYEQHGVSSVLVVGGAGDYFDVADHVLLMADYRAEDATARAKAIALEMPTGRQSDAPSSFRWPAARSPRAESIDPHRGARHVKIDVRDPWAVRFGEWTIELWAVEQLVETAQTRAIGGALIAMRSRLGRAPHATIAELLDDLERTLDERGLDSLSADRVGHFARPRRFEIACALNRLRSLRVHAKLP